MSIKKDEACKVLAHGQATEHTYQGGCLSVFLPILHSAPSHSPAPIFVSSCEPCTKFLRNPCGGEIPGAWA